MYAASTIVACFWIPMYACYQVAEPQKRPDIMYEIWANAEDEDIKLENVMQYGGQELKDVDGFISGWIGYLGTKKEALGWSCTFMKEGLAIYLRYLFNGKPMHSGIKKKLNITKNAFGSDYDDESFYTIFLSCFSDFSGFSYLFWKSFRLFRCVWGAVLVISVVSAIFFGDFSGCFAVFGELF